MSDCNKKQEIEEDYDRPLLVEKIMLSEAEVEELERMNKEVSIENGEILAAGQTTLDIFVQKSEAFVRRLEKELENCKSENANTVELTEAMVYPGSASNEFSDSSDAQEKKDPIDKLKNWYPTIEESVKTQKDQLNACAYKWFQKLQKFASRDVVENKSSKTSDQDWNHNSNLLIYVAIVLACVINAFFSYGPEDVQRCTDEPMECVVKDIKDFFQRAMDGYLEFHNISLKNQGAKMENVTNVLDV